MHKSLVIFALLLGTMGFAFFRTRELLLAYYLLSPLFLFPLFYFLKEKRYWFLTFSLAAVALFHGWFFLTLPFSWFFGFMLIQAVLFLVFVYHYTELKNFFKIADDEKEEVRKTLENLQTKYQTRLNSLRHLELQVGSLMNLFEIARDFSECMDFETLAEFLFKKLRSELAFQKMNIFLIQKNGTPQDSLKAKIFAITPEGVQHENRELLNSELEVFQILMNTRTMQKHSEGLHFPVFEGENMIAVFSIFGIHQDDLARVEVLSAYLVLLIKKIRLYETVKELSIIDELTQVFVRHHFMERLEEELKRSIRFKLPMAVLMLDIDHFKRYNDEFGHLVGDATLKEVADILKRNLRRVDLVGRYGGEEFIVAMPETRVANATEVAERIRSNIARHDFQVYMDKTKVTVSQGITVFEGESMISSEAIDTKAIAIGLIEQADGAMYRAKEEGRNRVCLFKDNKES